MAWKAQADWGRLERELHDMPKQMAQAKYVAIRDTANQARKMAEDLVLEEYPNLTRSKLGGGKFRRRAIFANVRAGNPPEGSVTIAEVGIPLIAFKPKATKRGGVTVQMAKFKGPQRFVHAFKAKMQSGHTGIFERVKGKTSGRQHMGWWGKRTKNRHDYYQKGGLTPRGITWALPIKELTGPDPYTLANIPEINLKIQANIQGLLAKNLDSQIDRFVALKPS